MFLSFVAVQFARELAAARGKVISATNNNQISISKMLKLSTQDYDPELQEGKKRAIPGMTEFEKRDSRKIRHFCGSQCFVWRYNAGSH
jgi:hypothetical protein